MTKTETQTPIGSTHAQAQKRRTKTGSRPHHLQFLFRVEFIDKNGNPAGIYEIN